MLFENSNVCFAADCGQISVMIGSAVRDPRESFMLGFADDHNADEADLENFCWNDRF